MCPLYSLVEPQKSSDAESCICLRLSPKKETCPWPAGRALRPQHKCPRKRVDEFGSQDESFRRKDGGIDARLFPKATPVTSKIDERFPYSAVYQLNQILAIIEQE